MIVWQYNVRVPMRVPIEEAVDTTGAVIVDSDQNGEETIVREYSVVNLHAGG